jgi:predicted nucleic acid-binding protein
MKYVLDSSVALKWVLAEPDSPKAKQLRDDFRNHIHELLAPEVFQVEIAHALTRAERRGRITPPQAGIFWSDIMSTPPRLDPSGPLIPRAIQISSAAHIGVYDCLYVALAEREGCEFVTADSRLVNILRSRFSFVIELSVVP